VPQIIADKNGNIEPMKSQDRDLLSRSEVLPLLKDAIIGQVTVMIDNDIAYVYFQMNDGFPMKKTSIYFSSILPESGIPCSYTYNTEYTDAQGTWVPTLTDTYVIENLSEIMIQSGSDNSDKKLYITTYVDFCE